MHESSGRKIRVFLIDDHPIVREGFARALTDAPDIVVVGQAETAADALKEAPFTSPDVILVDLNMPDRDGIELIGADSAAADAEAMLVAAEALLALGVQRLSLDLTLPTMAPALLDASHVSGPARQALARALDRKDIAAVAEHGGAMAPMLAELVLAAGPAEGALAALEKADLPAPQRALAARLSEVVALLRAQAPHLRLTIDPLEFRGFRYHTGIAVTVFAPGRHEEMGRGGRYLSADGEPATGVTLFADAILRAAPPPSLKRKILVSGDGSALRQAGFATLSSLGADISVAEAQRLSCTHVFLGGQIVVLPDAN